MENATFILNGREVTAEYEGRMTLLKYLRNVECMKGSKEGCSTGHCGACSVLIDGILARSCVTVLKTLAGKSVETIENLPNDTMLQVIQRSFLDAGAVQCGFCTPGMIMAAKALLCKTVNPTEEDIYDGLKHNYCRCTGYVKIIEGVKLAAARLRGENVPLTAVQVNDPTEIVTGKGQIVPEIEGRFVGQSVWDVDGLAKTAGTLKYCDDYEADEFGEDTMLHGAFVFAPVPHARINAVDYSAAESAPGVARIVTHKDVPGLNKIGTWTPDQPVFCSDEVRFLGDFVAMVVADTPEHARAAVKLVKIDYTELPGIYTMAEGVKADSYIVRTGRETGDVEKCKAEAEIVKVRVSKDIQPQDHVCMEPVSAIGYAKDGRVTVYACTQAPFEVRRMLAKNLAMDEENIRVVATPLGGGFGKKCDSFLEAPAAVAALCCDKPVKVTLTRQEDMIVTTRRHGYHTDYEIGFSKDGRFRYLDSFMFSDGGPYEAESYGTLMTGCLMSGGPYIIPNVRVDARCIRDNNLQGGAFRGYGINQAAISIETALDEMAEKLGIDPFELRRRNAVYPGSCSVGGELLESSMGMHDTIDLCEKAVREALREYEGQYPNGTKVLGWGVASGFKNSGIGKGIFIDDGACRLTLDGEGKLHMIVSGTDMGQGFRTAMVQIAAETLRILIDFGGTGDFAALPAEHYETGVDVLVLLAPDESSYGRVRTLLATTEVSRILFPTVVDPRYAAADAVEQISLLAEDYNCAILYREETYRFQSGGTDVLLDTTYTDDTGAFAVSVTTAGNRFLYLNGQCGPAYNKEHGRRTQVLAVSGDAYFMPETVSVVLYGAGVDRIRLPMSAYRRESYTAAGGFTVIFGTDSVREVIVD